MNKIVPKLDLKKIKSPTNHIKEKPLGDKYGDL